ncbi:site-specific integrase [Bradyrhizobium sp. 44]|uniref:tyrosine-type recombinase/integrase n=1 Tax=Bradyrhizobium sp. 44 TaxID=2782675 RepID=UPI001FFBAB2E|nr:site-specific integrase [Bradyrhizobium sp. 44]MCK1284096.1 site-specific integrase [Bradyrhizobium sp. 44]
MSRSVNITRRERRRKLTSGAIVVQTRWVLNYREPRSGQRRQLFFERQKDAQARRNQIIAEIETSSYSEERSRAVTIREIVQRWLESREGEVKPGTLDGYRRAAANIVGPLLVGSSQQRTRFKLTGKQPEGTKIIPLLGRVRARELTTSDIRSWHKVLTTHVGAYSANRAKMFLVSVLSLAAEDLNIRPPAMPTNLGRGRTKLKKSLLSTAQVSEIIEHARRDRERGLYAAFPFLSGTRPSEQLGLLWEDVDFEANVIHIRRMQERDGSITNFTKTMAGARDVPMGTVLRGLLLEWKLSCPRRDGALHRVFPGLGNLQPWPLPRIGGGGPLLYWNFRRRFWASTLKKLGLPPVTPHSARHWFISALQAQGIEVGLVAKIAGHANANVTLGHYTHAVRGAESAAAAIERAFVP